MSYGQHDQQAGGEQQPRPSLPPIKDLGSNRRRPSIFNLGKIAKVEGPQISFAEVEGLGTGTAVNGPIVAVALKTRSSSQKVQGTQVVTSEFDRQERPPSL